MGEKVEVHRGWCSQSQPMERRVKLFDSKKRMEVEQCPECKVEVLICYVPIVETQPARVAERR